MLRMITVVPVDDNKIASHFARAQEFAFLNEKGELVKRMANPALNTEGCQGRAKRMLVAQLAQEEPDRVLARDLGRCMLRKLLAADLKVFQTSASALFEDLEQNLVPLTSPEQVHKSPHQQKKEQAGQGGCCSQKGQKDHGQHQHSHGDCGCH